MELKGIVVDFEYAKKLKELGVKQKNLFYWNDYDGLFLLNYPKDDAIFFSAFTSDEILEMLPIEINTIPYDFKLMIDKMYGFEKDFYSIYYLYEDQDDQISFRINDILFEDEKLSNALAKMLIWLIENKYIELEEINE